MASLYRRSNSPFWYCAYFTPDGARHWRSTGATDRKKAEEIARAWDKAVIFSAEELLTPERAREIIAAGVADVYLRANREHLPHASVRHWCTSWLETKEIEAESSTLSRYKGILDRFVTFLGIKADKDLATITPTIILDFRDKLARELSQNSSRLAVKVLRSCFNDAHRQGIISSNPAQTIKILKKRGESKRRPFTMDEIRRLLAKCEGTEWRGMLFLGLYTGQRLGDLARMTWRAVDLEQKTIAFTTGKTGRRMVLPLAKPLHDYLMNLPSCDTPDAPLFPTLNAAAEKRVGTLSNQFYEILVDAGLAPARSHTSKGKGRDTTRSVGELSFHSLRHSATSLLKAAGVSDAIAREIIGHDSAAVSRQYTHLATEDLRSAVDKLPDVTKIASRKGKTR